MAITFWLILLFRKIFLCFSPLFVSVAGHCPTPGCGSFVNTNADMWGPSSPFPANKHADAVKKKMNRTQRRRNRMYAAMIKLMPEELERAAGKTFTWNHYRKHQHEEAGIKVVTHFIAKNEYWWKGENTGEKGANPVVYYTAIKRTYAEWRSAIIDREYNS